MKKFNLTKTLLSFMAMGKTSASREANSFNLYTGLGSSYVLAVNPDKAKTDELMGFESQNAPEYTGSNDNGKFARVTFIVRTDPEQCKGVTITNRITFTVYNAPAYNRDKTKVQVIDRFGNATWATVEDAKAGKKLLSANGNPVKIADNYRIAYRGEADLIDFLKSYLGIRDAFEYVNGTFALRSGVDLADYDCGLEHIKDLFAGNFKEIQDDIALQPNNKILLLYGIRTNAETGRKYQTIATRANMFLRNAGQKAVERLKKELANAKQNGSFANSEFVVGEFTEYKVEPTNLENPVEESQDPANDLPWDV